MLPTLIETLEPLAASRALHLVVGLYISGALLLACPDDRLLVPFFLIQRGLILALLWPNIGLYPVAASAAASLAIGLVCLITAWCLHHQAGAAIAHLKRSALPLTHLPFRAMGAALAVLLTYGLAQRYAPSQLPALVSWSVGWLVVQFCFSLLLAPTALHTGLGILAFADAGRILYALIRPDALVWGLWAASDVLVALAAAHLRTVEVTCAGGGSRRPARRGIRDILLKRSKPAVSEETAAPDGTTVTEKEEQGLTDTAATSAGPPLEPDASEQDEPVPETGETSCTSTG